MNDKLNVRKATSADLKCIVNLLLEDDLAKTRETMSANLDQRYINAFAKISADSNQYLMVVELDAQIVATCHLTIMPSLTYTGSTRMQIEAVRVSSKYRGHKIGEWMIIQAIEYAKSQDVSMIQLTTNKQRDRAQNFYKKLGFEVSYEGMKYYIKS